MERTAAAARYTLTILWDDPAAPVFCTVSEVDDARALFASLPAPRPTLVCIGGVDTDPDLHVLDTNGEIIPGLYANGTIAGNFCGNNYTTVFPGLNFGRSLCFGYLLGQYLTDNE